MNFRSVVSLLVISVLCSSSLIQGQQSYERVLCGSGGSSPGYSCNGRNRSCQAYISFRSQPSYSTVASISALLSADPSQVAQINSVSENATFETNKLVLVPVNCSCSGDVYQANASYVVRKDDTYFSTANDIYGGLSTCQALERQNNIPPAQLKVGQTISVPLRCACPTRNQSSLGINYLLTYLVASGDTVSDISARFEIDTEWTLQANMLSGTAVINSVTTLLIPLENPPRSSQTVVQPPPPASPPRPSSPSPDSDNSSNKTWIYVLVGVLAGTAAVVVIGIILFFAFFRKRKMTKSDPIIVSQSFEAREKPVNEKLEEGTEEFLESLSSIAESVKVYKFEELKAATENFSPSCWIKGSVYRGLINGDFAAIKKMNGDVSKEINLLSKINHSNLIRLSGVCFSDGNWYLVYEYAANGPLIEWIYYSNNDGKFLKWTQRIQIALDVATGLNYLHNFTTPPHIHKDVKSSNVLLDSDFRAKIASLALARSANGQDGEFDLTRHIVGTKGYMAPEYLENGLVSTKLDVYAFGVLMLEIITGKEVAALYTEENMNLSDVLNHTLSAADGRDSLRQFIDPSIRDNHPLELLVFVLRLIHGCLNKNPVDRPTMDEIVQSLSRILTASLAWES